MSADLFAEFGAPSQGKPSTSGKANAQSVPQPTNFFDDFSTTPYPQQQSGFQPATIDQSKSTDESDDWGDFEGPASSAPEPARQDVFSLQQSPQQNRAWEPPLFRKPRDPDVLFDATETDEGDEFGDFEGSDSPWTHSTMQPQENQVVHVPQQTIPVASRMHSKNTASISSFKSINKAGNFGAMSLSKQPKENPPPPSGNAESTDAWDTFADWEASLPSPAPETSRHGSKASITAPVVTSLTTNDPEPGELPPTNVPPPGVLLSLFLPLFAEAQDKLFKPMAAQPLPMRNRLLAEPATITFLQGYLMLASVAAHIIAGRKLRWKRDTHLSQGMKIGPASSRGTSGMKLAGVEKGEAMREDREVLDVVRTWKDQLGRLRHAAAAANANNAGCLGPVPELQEKMPVRVLKETEGGVRAHKQCMLCGLKREERVDGVDQGVEDSFGEWWIDQVSMHRGCRNFWQEHKKTLQQR